MMHVMFAVFAANDQIGRNLTQVTYTQQAFTYSKSTIGTPEQCVNSVQS